MRLIDTRPPPEGIKYSWSYCRLSVVFEITVYEIFISSILQKNNHNHKRYHALPTSLRPTVHNV